MTSSLTLVVVLALLFGGEVLFGFSLALAIGILIGTYSSIFVAGALAVVMGLTREHLIPQKLSWSMTCLGRLLSVWLLSFSMLCACHVAVGDQVLAC